MNIKQALQALKAKRRMQKEAAAAYAPYLYKLAAQPPMDPSMMGGMPMDPSMGGAPPMDPSMMGGAPPMDPSMMGGMPMDPSMMGGMPPQGGMPMAAPAPAAQQGQTPQETEQKVSNKIKTEQWMQHIDSYNYNLLKLMINLYEHLGIPVPAESLLPAPLGQSAPSAGDISGMMGAAATATSPQTPVDAMAEGDVQPPQGGGMPPMDPSMMGDMPMDPSMIDPSMLEEGDIPEDMPPMEGGDIKQSSWGLYDPYSGRLRSRWRSPLHKQAGVFPYSSNRAQSTAYLDVLNKLSKLGYFD